MHPVDSGVRRYDAEATSTGPHRISPWPASRSRGNRASTKPGAVHGPWYVAGNNPFDQWRDTDFLIPPTVTAGKTTITVTLRFVSSSLDWNEFTYWAYTLTQ